MRNLCCFILLLFWAVSGYAQNSSYLFVWAGDDAKKSSDFLAVLDTDEKSPHYGQAVASVAVPGPSGTPHHTELEVGGRACQAQRKLSKIASPATRRIKISVIGRKSARAISIPVWFVAESGKLYLFPLHGSDTQWHKNVLHSR